MRRLGLTIAIMMAVCVIAGAQAQRSDQSLTRFGLSMGPLQSADDQLISECIDLAAQAQNMSPTIFETQPSIARGATSWIVVAAYTARPLEHPESTLRICGYLLDKATKHLEQVLLRLPVDRKYLWNVEAPGWSAERVAGYAKRLIDRAGDAAK